MCDANRHPDLLRRRLVQQGSTRAEAGDLLTGDRSPGFDGLLGAEYEVWGCGLSGCTPKSSEISWWGSQENPRLASAVGQRSGTGKYTQIILSNKGNRFPKSHSTKSRGDCSSTPVPFTSSVSTCGGEEASREKSSVQVASKGP